jgi:hypothetical protein
MTETSVSKNVHETILKIGLDYLINDLKNGEAIVAENTSIIKALGRVYDAKFDWCTDYQFKLMNAMYPKKEDEKKQ